MIAILRNQLRRSGKTAYLMPSSSVATRANSSASLAAEYIQRQARLDPHERCRCRPVSHQHREHKGGAAPSQILEGFPSGHENRGFGYPKAKIAHMVSDRARRSCEFNSALLDLCSTWVRKPQLRLSRSRSAAAGAHVDGDTRREAPLPNLCVCDGRRKGVANARP
jgi:hypothetical protein